jgi:hypothetical protein
MTQSLSVQRLSRRTMLGRLGTGVLAAGASQVLPRTVAAQGRPPVGRIVDVQSLGADSSGREDSAPALQRAIDEVAPTGGIIYLPAGRYRIARTLVWHNRGTGRAPGITFQGDGMHSTVLLSAIGSGPVLRVRGTPSSAPAGTTFFWGGGLRDLTIEGGNGGPEQHGLDVLGWYYGEIENCNFVRLGGDGIRATVDLELNANPDVTSSDLFVRGVWFERLGGWGFRDMSEVQGAPAWLWDRCVFALCRAGGALVRSSSHSFTKCSFSGCGWQDERSPAAQVAYGLFFDGSATTSSKQWVEGCEFDANLTAHIGARFLTSSTIVGNRFIFNDRFGRGRINPPVGIEIGSGDAGARVLGVAFQRNFFRFDIPGQVVVFDFANSANVRDVEISGSVFSEVRPSDVTRYRGQDPAGRGAAYGFVITDRPREGG